MQFIAIRSGRTFEASEAIGKLLIKAGVAKAAKRKPVPPKESRDLTPEVEPLVPLAEESQEQSFDSPPSGDEQQPTTHRRKRTYKRRDMVPEE